MLTNKRILLSQLPTGKLTHDCFSADEVPVTAAADGEVVIKTLVLSQDAANRAWMQGATYRSALADGDVMASYGIGEIIESNHPAWAVGSKVMADIGWQEYATLHGDQVTAVPEHDGPLSHGLSLLGVAGLTAYHERMSKHVKERLEG